MAIVKKGLILKTSKQVLFIILIAVFAGLVSNLLRADKIPFIESRPVKTGHIALSGKNFEISLEEAVELFRKKSATFMDARSPAEYSKGHIKGAISFPYEEADRNFIKIMSGVTEDNVIVTYCDGEACELGMDLAVFLRDAGYKKVRVFFNGWSEWQQHKLPVEAGN